MIDERRVELLRVGLELGIPAGELVAWAKEAEGWLMPGASERRRAMTPERRAAQAATWTPERRVAQGAVMRRVHAARKAAANGG